MNKDAVLELIKEMVRDRFLTKKYPAHILLQNLRKEAKNKFSDYTRDNLAIILKELRKENLIIAGNTINDIYIKNA